MRIMGRWKRKAFEWTKSTHGTKRTQQESSWPARSIQTESVSTCEYYMIGEAICNLTCPCPAPHLPSVKVHLVEQHDVPVWLLERWPDMATQVAWATLTQSGGGTACYSRTARCFAGVFPRCSCAETVRDVEVQMLCPLFEGTRRTGKKRITAAWSTQYLLLQQVTCNAFLRFDVDSAIKRRKVVSFCFSHTHTQLKTHTSLSSSSLSTK